MRSTSPVIEDSAVAVLIIDAQTMVRSGLSNMLMESGEFVVGQSESVDDALTVMAQRRFDVVVLAGSMSSQQRRESVDKFNRIHADVPLLIIDDSVDEVFAREIMKNGANGYISRHSDPQELMEALRRLNDGTSYMSNDAARKLAVSALSREVDPVSTLSPRELQVFERLARGEAVGAIAKELKLTSKTVSNHRLAVLKKMGVKTTVELAHIMHRRGMQSG